MLRSSRNIAAFFVIERVVEDVRCGVNRFSSVFAKTGTFWQDLQSQYVSVLSYVMCLYYVCCVAQSALIFIIIYRQSGAQLKCNYRSIRLQPWLLQWPWLTVVNFGCVYRLRAFNS